MNTPSEHSDNWSVTAAQVDRILWSMIFTKKEILIYLTVFLVAFFAVSDDTKVCLVSVQINHI